MVQSKYSPEMPPGKFEPIKSEKRLRPVVVRYQDQERLGYFHCWSHYIDGDDILNTIGTVQWLDGTCATVDISKIKFTDR